MSHTTCLKDTPNVHIHYLIDDELCDIQGYSEVEVCCHACGAAIKVLFNLPKIDDPVWQTLKDDDGLPELKKLRNEFEQKHKNCVAIEPAIFCGLLGKGNEQFRSLCPPWRKYAEPETIDLRHDKPEQRMI